MKNITKLFTIVFIFLLTAILLVSCGGNSGKINEGSTSDTENLDGTVKLSEIKYNNNYLEDKFIKKTIDYIQLGQDVASEALEKRYNTSILLYKDQIPFISLKNFLNILQDTIDFGSKEFKDGKTATGEKLTYKHYLEYAFASNLGTLTSYYTENFNGQLTDSNETITFNPDTDTVSVSDIDLYNILEKEEPIEDDGVASKIEINEKMITPENELIKSYTFNLRKYNLDLIQYNNDVYAPVALLNQLVLPQSYFKVYYNGDFLYGIDFSLATDTKTASRFTSSNYYSDPEKSVIVKDLKQFDFDFMSFVYDNFYGLDVVKQGEHTAHDYKKMLAAQKEFIINGDNVDYQDGIINVVNGLDDLHSFMILNESFYFTIQLGGEIVLTPNKGADSVHNPRTQKYDKDSKEFEDLLDEYAKNHDGELLYDDYTVAYTKDNKTAIITFYDFNEETRDKIDKLFKELKPGVENVVFNLMRNAGGIVGVFYEIMGHMTDKPFNTYSIDKFSNRKYELEVKSLIEKKNYNFFLFTSGITFSSGNLMTKVFKDNKLGKVIGTKTAGGSSSIVPFLLQSGLFIAMSSKDNKTDSNFKDSEFGVEPDIVASMKDLFNLDKVQELINNNK